MKGSKNYFLTMLLLICHNVFASNTASPYLQILNKDSDIDRMPLLMTTVDANITGLIVEVRVTQIYKNYGSKSLEAQYVFPGSRRAAVHKVTMKIGERILDAEIQEKQQARKTYQKAKSEGKTTTLLEQKDPGLFTMMVANILPNDEIEVEMTYTERLIPENGKYQFNYPAIGIPSVLNNKKGHAHISNDDEMGFDMIIQLNSPIAIDEIQSINHEVEIDYLNENRASIVLAIDETLNFKENFIIEYSLLGKKINSGILLYEDEVKDESYFLMMIEPPKKIKTDELVPREYIFVVDSSGSMGGKPLMVAQEITKQLLSELKPHELFNVILFAGGSSLLSPESMSPTEYNIKIANQMVDVSSAGGGTYLLSAINTVQTIPLTDGVSRTLIVLTDGGINVSSSTLDAIRKNNHKQNLFVIGVSRYNNDLPAVESLAQAGNGQEFIITDPAQLAEMQQQFLDYVRYPLLTDIKVKTLGFTEVDLQPSSLPDLFSKRPLFLTGKFKGTNKGSIQINGVGGKNNFSNIFDLARVQSKNENKAIKYLWAKEKIIMLGDGYLDSSNQSKIQKITDLGLAYNLLTNYTSFVAVDKSIRNKERTTSVGNTAQTEDKVSLDYVVATGASYGYGSIESHDINLRNKVLPSIAMLQPPMELSNISLPSEITNERPSVTFILGKDKGKTNQYYHSATQIFSENLKYKTDYVITDLTTIEEVKNYLAKHTYTPWGIVNIVTHSTSWSGLSIKLKKADAQILDVYTLSKIINSSSFNPIPNNILDNNSEIRLLGCGLGKHQQLMQMLSIYFGGHDLARPTIKSPIDYLYMAVDEKSIKTFKNGFALINPLFKNDNRKILKIINQKNPYFEFTSLDNWKRKAVQVSTTIKAVKNINKISALNLAMSQKSIDIYLEELGASWSDFKWKKIIKNNRLEIIGSSILMTQKVENIDSESLSILDLNDDMKTKIIRPY